MEITNVKPYILDERDWNKSEGHENKIYYKMFSKLNCIIKFKHETFWLLKSLFDEAPIIRNYFIQREAFQLGWPWSFWY